MKTNNLKLIVLIASLGLANLYAQEKPAKVKEYGIGFNSLNSYALQYRWGKESKLKRLTINLGGSSSFGNRKDNYTQQQSTNTGSGISKSNTPINIYAGLGYSIFKLKPLNDKFGLIFGYDFSIKYAYTSSESLTKNTTTNPSVNAPQISTQTTGTENTQSVLPSFGMILGAYYVINSSFRVYAEISPRIYYDYSIRTDRRETTNDQNPASSSTTRSTTYSNSFGFTGLSNSGAMISFIYRIGS